MSAPQTSPDLYNPSGWSWGACLLMEETFSCATGSGGVASALGSSAGHLGWALPLCVPCVQLSYGSLFPWVHYGWGGLLGASRCPVVAELVSADFSQAPRRHCPTSLEPFLLI